MTSRQCSGADGEPGTLFTCRLAQRRKEGGKQLVAGPPAARDGGRRAYKDVFTASPAASCFPPDLTLTLTLTSTSMRNLHQY